MQLCPESGRVQAARLAQAGYVHTLNSGTKSVHLSYA